MKQNHAKRMTSLLLAMLLILSMLPAASAASADLSVDVEPGETITFSRSDFKDLFEMEEDSEYFSYLVFTDLDGMDDYGYFTAYDAYEEDCILDEGDMDDARFYYHSDDAPKKHYALDDLSFTVHDDADEDSIFLDFILVGEDDTEVYGVLELSIISSSGGSGEAIVYEVYAGEETTFSSSDFYEYFEENYSYSSNYSLRYVEFDKPASSDLSDGTLYHNYGKSSAEEFTRSSFSQTTFYYDDEDDDYSLDKLSFVADDTFDTDVELTFRAYYSSSRSVEGTVLLKYIEDDEDTSYGSIRYEVTPGEKTAFSASDFYEYFEDNYSSSSYSLRYVVFDKPTSADLSDGTLYYNYGKSSAEEFTRSSFSEAVFYYDDDEYGDYSLGKLSFVADKSFDTDVELTFRAYYSSSRYVDGSVLLEYEDDDKDDDNTITYEVTPGEKAAFSASDFYEYFEDHFSSSNYSLRYVTFNKPSSSALTDGTLYYNYGKSSEESFSRSSFSQATFYYDDDDFGSYPLSKLSFVADDSFDTDVELTFRAYYNASRYVDGTVLLKCEEGSAADLRYTAEAGEQITFGRNVFRDLFAEEYPNDSLQYMLLSSTEHLDNYGALYSYNSSFNYTKLDAADARNTTFYYYASDVTYSGAYYLSYLTFEANSTVSSAGQVTLEYTLYGENGNRLSGVVVIDVEKGTAAPSSGSSITSSIAGDILYQASAGTNVQLKAADFTNFLQDRYPASTLQAVLLGGVPSTGGLYYNYYGASSYGSTSRMQLTTSNYSNQYFYLSPASTSQYALSELLYVPTGSNYTVSIPFTAYGSSSTSVSGTILISISAKAAIPEVYGVITSGIGVNFPSSSLSSAVSAGTGSTLYGIQLLQLPSSSQGAVYVGSGTTTRANTTTVYGAGSSTQAIDQLRFVGANGYTGNVSIPYVAYDSSLKAIGVGKFSLGIVSSQKKFSDVTSSTWCYKYVAELADAGVIGGYSDGTFRPDDTISYGAALKLIMLAAGYAEQAPTNSNVFSGYLAKARADGIITRSNVDLTASITRLQVAQLAAGALKLNLTNQPSVSPFTDTSDLSVVALNGLGIVEGYFNNGVSTYKPGNTLTRGHVSAIVWRMLNYRK